MRILHFSDLHGRANAAAQKVVDSCRPDWIVLTGDMVQDSPWRPGVVPQLRQWERQRSAFLRPGLPTTFVRGNHEREGFTDLELQSARPEGLAPRIGVLEGIPSEFGPWGFPRELEAKELMEEVEGQGRRDIWLSHVPPFGILDRTRHGTRVGHRPLAALCKGPEAPDLVLCGHVHESAGVQTVGRTLVVNAAGGYALVDWNPGKGRAELLALEVLVRFRPLRGFLEALRPGG